MLAAGAGAAGARVPAVVPVRRAAGRRRRDVQPVLLLRRPGSWWTFSPLSSPAATPAARLTTGPAEYNTFLGWPLLLVAAALRGLAAAAGRWSSPASPAALVMGALSLGPEVVLDGERTALPGPYTLLADLPVVDGALPMRFAPGAAPADRHAAGARGRPRPLRRRRPGPAAGPAAPSARRCCRVFPAPLPTTDRPRGAGVHHRRPLAAVRTPPAGCSCRCRCPPRRSPWPMRWATAARRRVRHARGLLHRPVRPGRHGHRWAPTSSPRRRCWPRWPGAACQPPITDEQRRPGRPRTSRFWRAACVALTDDAPHAEQPAAHPGAAARPRHPDRRHLDLAGLTRVTASPATAKQAPPRRRRRQGPSVGVRRGGAPTGWDDLGELLARVVQLAQRDDLALEEERQRPVDHDPDLAVERRDPAHVVRPVHEPGRPAASS